MKAEMRQAWIDALLSGKYVQGKGALRDAENHYCCLGVLHEVAGGKWSDEPTGKSTVMTEARDAYSVSCEGATNPSQMLGLRRSEALGLEIRDGCFLAEKNDDGLTFDQIATLIKERVQVDPA